MIKEIKFITHHNITGNGENYLLDKHGYTICYYYLHYSTYMDFYININDKCCGSIKRNRNDNISGVAIDTRKNIIIIQTKRGKIISFKISEDHRQTILRGIE